MVVLMVVLIPHSILQIIHIIIIHTIYPIIILILTLTITILSHTHLHTHHHHNHPIHPFNIISINSTLPSLYYLHQPHTITTTTTTTHYSEILHRLLPSYPPTPSLPILYAHSSISYKISGSMPTIILHILPYSYNLHNKSMSSTNSKLNPISWISFKLLSPPIFSKTLYLFRIIIYIKMVPPHYLCYNLPKMSTLSILPYAHSNSASFSLLHFYYPIIEIDTQC